MPTKRHGKVRRRKFYKKIIRFHEASHGGFFGVKQVNYQECSHNGLRGSRSEM